MLKFIDFLVIFFSSLKLMDFLKMKKSWSLVRFLRQTTSVCTWEHE